MEDEGESWSPRRTLGVGVLLALLFTGFSAFYLVYYGLGPDSHLEDCEGGYRCINSHSDAIVPAFLPGVCAIVIWGLVVRLAWIMWRERKGTPESDEA
jgi:hypothetical protein